MKTAKRIEAKLRNRQDEIKTTLKEMIDVIEKYFHVTPFDFIEGREGEATWHVFPDKKASVGRFYGWAENWMAKLFPRSYESQVSFDAATGVVEKKYPLLGVTGEFPTEQDHQVKLAWNKIQDLFGELAFDAQRFGFVVGVLVGCKAMGATREQLMEKCQGFILPTISHARFIAKSDAEKAGKGGKP